MFVWSWLYVFLIMKNVIPRKKIKGLRWQKKKSKELNSKISGTYFIWNDRNSKRIKIEQRRSISS